jgi:hypothetical protein
MNAPEVAGKLDATAWTVLVLGVVCAGLGALQAVLPAVLDRVAGQLDSVDDPTRRMRDALASGAALSATLNVGFGAAAIVIAVAVVRRSRWAHAAITILCWSSIAVLVALAKPSLAPILVLSEGRPIARACLVVSTAILLVAQVLAVVWFLRFWRRPDIRASFR